MEKQLRTIRGLLDQARERTDRALDHAGGLPPEQIRSLGWRYTGCRHVKYFTRPMAVDLAPPCAKCKGENFEPA